MTVTTRLALVSCIVLTTGLAAAQEPAPQSEAAWRRMHAMGLAHDTASGLFQALKAQAGGGQVSPPFDRLPDWSGLWMAAGGGSFFGAGPGGVEPQLSAAGAAALRQGRARAADGIEYDENLSECGPPGFPRWLVIPFLREFIVRPEQTWLSSETVNNVRRIYTDGRDHPSPEEAFPLYYGDSIGFWDNGRLVIHTSQLMARSMGRNQPDQSEQMETVEIWEKVSADTIVADVWLYDPGLYAEPWYLRRRYRQVPNPGASLRMHYWHCGENPNNDVFRTPDGGTQYEDFTFTGDDNPDREPRR